MARLYIILKGIFTKHRSVLLYSGLLIVMGILACLKYIKDLCVNTGILFIVIGVVFYLVESADRRSKKLEEKEMRQQVSIRKNKGRP
ncbi:hypothetical protein SAMN05192529_103156 [Arachidicoccus rhizosphaerae]|uniref:Uncharacterized protein n=1 Tax=Arachidicoccus rhizosphaerae TaxID=551991 RepID=A0A1H3WN83_9BACT|nr:hypothetical protein [Arachidicoccus rhizosphaerae]SDZ88410.1 hypothetical protein SAMN05192529_103156 [Arachidicoccus rhizosphaerae]